MDGWKALKDEHGYRGHENGITHTKLEEKKFDPKQITAMNTPMKPKAISFIFKMEEIKLYQCRALESSDRRLVAKFSPVGL